MQQTGKRKITFEYRIPADLKFYSVTGIIGGMNPVGQIEASFFYERKSIPTEVTHELEPSGNLGKEIERKSSDHLVREIQFGMSIAPATARSIASWLNLHADQLEKLVREKIKNDN